MPENEHHETGAAETAAGKTARPRRRRTTRRRKPATHAKRTPKDYLFALDIGTRSVIGIIAEKKPDGLHIKETTRLEHKTRAMLDGQIHDVPQVAAIITRVKEALEKKVGKLHSAAVAAAGRALYTMTATAEKNVSGIISEAEQRDLDFAGVQEAQKKLAASHTVDDPSHYYCVGFSTIAYELDGSRLKSLVGQRGDKARAEVIATFLPRQVIDSMQSALMASGLSMHALTLEPIAAINVLIPPTMRHLNLVLVDIGAGTSDVAITRNGSVIAYGMVPKAGDEVTEAISQNFLLDFNIAEAVKRQASGGQAVSFDDILGGHYELSAEEIFQPILPQIRSIAGSIASEIKRLNGQPPQAVMLVGGGSLTPMLPACVAEALEMPANRVAVRQPEHVDGIEDIPEVLHSPDAVTPLGILKIAAMTTLHFLTVHVNDKEYSLFNFHPLTISDALLAAGLSLRKFNGRPGLGLIITIDGRQRSYPGTFGTLASITMDGAPATLDTEIRDGADIRIAPGQDGTSPAVRLHDALKDLPSAGAILYLNGRETQLPAFIQKNGEAIPPEENPLLKDGDTIEHHLPATVGEALKAAGLPPTGTKITYRRNGSEATFKLLPAIQRNGQTAALSEPITSGDHLDYEAGPAPTLAAVLGISELDAALVIYYRGAEYKIPAAGLHLQKNGQTVPPDTLLEEGDDIRYEKSERTATTVSDALAAVGFVPPDASRRLAVTLLVNGAPVDFNAPIKNGDTLDVKETPFDSRLPGADADARQGLDGDDANADHLTKDTEAGTNGTSEPRLSTSSTESIVSAGTSAWHQASATGNRPDATAEADDLTKSTEAGIAASEPRLSTNGTESIVSAGTSDWHQTSGTENRPDATAEADGLTKSTEADTATSEPRLSTSSTESIVSAGTSDWHQTSGTENRPDATAEADGLTKSAEAGATSAPRFSTNSTESSASIEAKNTADVTPASEASRTGTDLPTAQTDASTKSSGTPGGIKSLADLLGLKPPAPPEGQNAPTPPKPTITINDLFRRD